MHELRHSAESLHRKAGSIGFVSALAMRETIKEPRALFIVFLSTLQ